MGDFSRIASMIDHTNLKATATAEDMDSLCREARRYGFHSVCVNEANVGVCSAKLHGSGVSVCSVVGFPLGANSIRSKLAEADIAIWKGASEIDYVVNIGAAKEHDWDYLENEMRALVNMSETEKTTRSGRAIVKAIFEMCYLDYDEKMRLCEIAARVKPAFVKTSTGFGTGGATVEDVRLMRDNVPECVGVKASGGIRTLTDAEAMIAAGATRLGCSAGVSIAEELRLH